MKWSEIEIDAIREIANIGAGNSSTALARVLNKKVMIDVTDVKIIEVEKIPRLLKEYSSEKCTGILLEFQGDINGVFLHIIPQDARRVLINTIVSTVSPDLADSAIKELTNILIGNYLSAISKMLKMKIIHHLPQSAEDNVYAIVDGVLGEIALREETVFVFNTLFRIEGKDIKSLLMMLMYQEDVERFLEKIKSL